jgi:hypothetical protein
MIVQLTPSNEFILEYESLGDVTKLGFNYDKVRRALNTNTVCQGYKWQNMRNTDNIHEFNDREYLPKKLYGGLIEQLTKRNNHVRFWDNQFLAEQELDLPKGGIQKILNGEVVTTGGYVFKESV